MNQVFKVLNDTTEILITSDRTMLNVMRCCSFKWLRATSLCSKRHSDGWQWTFQTEYYRIFLSWQRIRVKIDFYFFFKKAIRSLFNAIKDVKYKIRNFTKDVWKKKTMIQQQEACRWLRNRKVPSGCSRIRWMCWFVSRSIDRWLKR